MKLVNIFQHLTKHTSKNHRTIHPIRYSCTKTNANPPSLYQTILPNHQWSKKALKSGMLTFHAILPNSDSIHTQERRNAKGLVSVKTGKGVLPKLYAWLGQLPGEMENGMFQQSIVKSGDLSEKWTRIFGDEKNAVVVIESVQGRNGYLVEYTKRFGIDIGIHLFTEVVRSPMNALECIGFRMETMGCSARVFGLNVGIPKFLRPNILGCSAVEEDTKEGWIFNVRVETPEFFGRQMVVDYRGHMELV